MTVFESLLNHEFSVAGLRRVPDGQGGWSKEFYPKADFRGRLRPANSRERELGAKEERVITHVFYCLANESIDRGDLVTPGVLSFDGFNTTSTDILVEVLGIREPSTSDEHWEIDCQEIQTEVSDVAFFYLLESGDFRLLESGDFRLLE